MQSRVNIHSSIGFNYLALENQLFKNQNFQWCHNSSRRTWRQDVFVCCAKMCSSHVMLLIRKKFISSRQVFRHRNMKVDQNLFLLSQAFIFILIRQLQRLLCRMKAYIISQFYSDLSPPLFSYYLSLFSLDKKHVVHE